MAETHVELPLNSFWTQWSTRAARQAAPGWADLVREMGGLQDAFAASMPPQETIDEVSALLARARELLAGHAVGDEDQLFGRFLLDPTRGQTFSPAVRLTSVGERTLTGETSFGRFHSGSYSAVHGGGVALLFDDMFGRLVSSGDIPMARTANLSVNYRSVTPIDVPLTVEVTVVEVDGRKWRLAGTLRHGDRLCADTTALFLTVPAP